LKKAKDKKNMLSRKLHKATLLRSRQEEMAKEKRDQRM
jgi:hypothetical protein